MKSKWFATAAAVLACRMSSEQPMKTLVVDNYDSFTFNLVHLLAEANQEEPQVIRNDELDWASLAKWEFDNIVISPGPGRPDRPADFGVSADIIMKARVPILGVCLGHQGIAALHGGAIIGAPAWKSGGTWLYLSGARAREVAACFAASPFETRVLSANIGEASALKMCYSAYSKGMTALLSAILATAETWGVREALYDQWAEGDANFGTRIQERIQRSLGKAWRFVGEMEEISATFSDAGMPGGFHAAAADVYRRLARFKDVRTPPALTDVLDALRQTEDQSQH